MTTVTTPEQITEQSTTPIEQIRNDELADQLGEVNALRKVLESKEKKIKEELKRRGSTPVRGRYYLVTISPKSRSVFNKAQLVADKGQDFVDQYTGQTQYQEVNISERGD